MESQQLRRALQIVAQVLQGGEATHPEDAPDHWRKLSPREHLARAATHIEQAILGRSDEDHAGHGLVRLLMAVELREREKLAGVQRKEAPE